MSYGICVHLSTCAHMYVGEAVVRQEVHVIHLLLSVPILVFKTRSLTKIGAHNFD